MKILRIDNDLLQVEKQSSLSDLLDLEPLAVVSIEEIEHDLDMMRLEAEKRIEISEQDLALYHARFTLLRLAYSFTEP